MPGLWWAQLLNSVVSIFNTGAAPAPVTPPVAGYTVWLDATDATTITSSGGDVSQWSDKSGNARDFTQSTATSKPKTGTRTINGLNTIDFDGTNDFLVCLSSTSYFNYIHSGTGATIFIVGIVDDTAGVKDFLVNNDGSSAQIGFRFAFTATETDLFRVSNGSGSTSVQSGDNVTFTAGTAFYTTIKVDADNGTAANRYKIAIDGGAEAGANAATTAPSSSNASKNLHLGIVSDGTSNPFNGCVGEILIYSGILSAGDITSTKTYLSDKWGI